MADFELVRELEQLRQKIQYYEEQVKPLAERELQRIREEQVKAYKLTDSQRELMLERLAEVNTEEAIQETALQLAGEFRATEKRYVEPSLGNGVKRKPVQKDGYNAGQKAFERLVNHNRYGKHVSTIKVPNKPAPTQGKRNGLLGRVFGRRAK